MTEKAERPTEEELEILYDGCAPDGFTEVDRTGWNADFKSEWNSTFYKRESDGTFWEVFETRSGSHFTDWYYDPAEVHQVVAETVQVVKYNRIK